MRLMRRNWMFWWAEFWEKPTGLSFGESRESGLGGLPPKPPEVEDSCVPHTPSKRGYWF